MRYHVSPEGNAGPCSAMVRCPFGDLDTDHFDTAEDARRAYERGEVNGTVPPPAKKEKSVQEQIDSLKEAERSVQSRIGKTMKTITNLKDAADGADKIMKGIKSVPFDRAEDRIEEVQRLIKIRDGAKAKEKQLVKDVDSLRQQASGITKKLNELQGRRVPQQPKPVQKSTNLPSPWATPSSSIWPKP